MPTAFATATAPPAIPAASAEIVYDADGCVMATWKNLLLCGWAKQGTVQIVQELGRLAGEFALAHPEGHSSIHIITNQAPLPPPEVRRELEILTRRHADEIACMGIVIDGEGFWAGAMRAFLTGLHWASRRPFQAHYCATLEELSRWLPAPHEARTHTPVSSGELAYLLTELRGRVTRPE